MNCPDCGGAMWDNRQSKRNPKQPDYKCKDKNCGKAVWENSRGGNGGNGSGPKHQPNQRERWTWSDLFLAYEVSHDRIRKTLGKDAPHDAVQAGVATLLITAEKMGLAGPDTLKKRAAAPKPERRPAPPPPPPEPEPEFEQEDDDLPF